MILMYALKTPLSAQCAGVLSTEHSVQSNPSALSALSTEMHHQNKTLSTKCCHPHGHSVLSTSTVCAPALDSVRHRDLLQFTGLSSLVSAAAFYS